MHHGIACFQNRAVPYGGPRDQSTVEYALVLFAFLASVVLALAKVVDWASSGGLFSSVTSAGSHSVGEGLLRHYRTFFSAEAVVASEGGQATVERSRRSCFPV